MPVFIISLIIQIALVVHIIKTGRNTIWIWVVILLPLAGTIAYLIVEVLPELTGSRTARRVGKNIGNAINPNKDIKQAAQNLYVSDTVENSLKLAEQCLEKNMFEDAKQLYEKSLTGIHAQDPDIMHGLAKAEFALGNFDRVKQLLDDLIANNPDYKNADAHLLYARSAEELNDTDLALQEYKVLDEYYPGPEASCRYAMLLKSTGDLQQANTIFEKIITLSRLSGKHYNTLHKEWIRLAKSEYTEST